MNTMLLFIRIDLINKYDLSFVTYVHRNKSCLFLFVLYYIIMELAYI